jgi:hypothetical protein
MIPNLVPSEPGAGPPLIGTALKSAQRNGTSQTRVTCTRPQDHSNQGNTDKVVSCWTIRLQARRPCIRRRKVAIRYRKPIWTGGAVSASLRLSSSGIAIAKEHEIQSLAEASLTPRNIAGL